MMGPNRQAEVVCRLAMLTSLSVRDLAVIERIDLEFGCGLTVLTGETGAGKSILLDALGLVTGRRADVAMVRPGADRASVTATFQVSPESDIAGVLRERGIDCDDELIVRRQIRADGRSKAHVNDEAVGVALLAELGDHLVEVHGQHDQRGLLRPSAHRSLLDAFGDHAKACGNLRQSHADWRAERARLEVLEADEAGRNEAAEALARDLEELGGLDPGEDEEERLASLRTRLANSQKVAEALSTAAEAIEGENGADAGLARACGALRRVADVAGGIVDEALGALDRALVEAAEASSALMHAADELEDDAGRLEEVEERLFALKSSARRHRTTVAGLVEVRERLEQELANLGTLEDDLESARQTEARLGEAFRDHCGILAGLRREAARALDLQVVSELSPLHMKNAVFETRLVPLAAGKWGADGAEAVRFTVVTNPGMPPGPLDRIASGGELSRFMLALKVAAQKGNRVETLIFDEIDSGIGGAVSDAVGERLWRLGTSAQVLVVTHAPQVAARADHHIHLTKEGTGRSVATRAGVLVGAQRQEELARMLAGAEVTAEARAAAASLLKAGAG